MDRAKLAGYGKIPVLTSADGVFAVQSSQSFEESLVPLGEQVRLRPGLLPEVLTTSATPILDKPPEIMPRLLNSASNER